MFQGSSFFRAAFICALFAMLMLTLSAQSLATDQAHIDQGQAASHRAIEFLRSSQNQDGSWSPKSGPAITALVLVGLLEHPDVGSDDAMSQRALAYILSKVREDGGIHEGFLQNYNTAICISALSRVANNPQATKAMENARDYLRRMQWSNQPDPTGKAVDKSHPFFGGAGYGHHGRPDMSNTQIMLEALHDSGLDCEDPAFQNALVFISRCQGTSTNTEYGDRIVPDGGFIYATSVDKEHIGIPQSQAGEVTIDVPGTGPVSKLRTYGSMTYAGFKSYLYAQLDRDDRRVTDAVKWIAANYTVDQNPGMPEDQKMQGHFYYLMTFARAFDAWGKTSITLKSGQQRDWGNDLVEKLVATQREDGSWSNEADRWMESDPNLVTAYAMIALNCAIR